MDTYHASLLKNKKLNKYASGYSRKVWEYLMDCFRNIPDFQIGCNDVSDLVLNAILDAENREMFDRKFIVKETDVCTDVFDAAYDDRLFDDNGEVIKRD